MTGNDFPEDDDYYEGDDEPRMSRGKLIIAILAVLIVVGFGTGIWYAYDQGVKKGVQLAPPIISADTSPVKEKPKDPGGMDIPHQDKQVFGVLKSDGEAVRVEKLMQPPEEATDDSETADSGSSDSTMAATSGDTSKEDLIGKTIEKVEKAAEATTETVEKTVKEAAPETKTEETVAAVAPTPVPVPKPAPTADDGPRYRVQLGSFRSKDAAEDLWKSLVDKHGSLLGDVSHRVQDVDVQGQGTFHRLQAGAYESKSSANKLCDALKAKKQDCLVVSS